MVYVQIIRYSPVGEYLRISILKRLKEGPAKMEEINEMAKRIVEQLGVKYDWRIWPRLFEGEVEIRGDVVAITQRGRWIFEQTKEEVAEYVKKWLGVSV